MSDPFSIALGVSQVAGTGFQLVETISTYIKAVRNAERQLQPIADYVKLTSTALEQIAAHLSDESLTSLYKPALLASTNDALKGCGSAFERLNKYLESLIKLSKDGKPVIITNKAKLKWPWKQKELEGHQIHLERYKSSVDLLLGTLTFVSSSRAAKDTSNIRLELQRLMIVEAEAKKKEIEIHSDRQLNPTEEVPVFSDASFKKLPTFSGKTEIYTPYLARNIVTSPCRHAYSWSPLQSIDGGFPSQETFQHYEKSTDTLLFHLNECATAMTKLSATLNTAISLREQSKSYDRSGLFGDFKSLQTAFNNMSRHEHRLEDQSQQAVTHKRMAVMEATGVECDMQQNTMLSPTPQAIQQLQQDSHAIAQPQDADPESEQIGEKLEKVCMPQEQPLAQVNMSSSNCAVKIYDQGAHQDLQGRHKQKDRHQIPSSQVASPYECHQGSPLQSALQSGSPQANTSNTSVELGRPETEVQHALSADLDQNVPLSRSQIKAWADLWAFGIAPDIMWPFTASEGMSAAHPNANYGDPAGNQVAVDNPICYVPDPLLDSYSIMADIDDDHLRSFEDHMQDVQFEPLAITNLPANADSHYDDDEVDDNIVAALRQAVSGIDQRRECSAGKSAHISSTAESEVPSVKLNDEQTNESDGADEQTRRLVATRSSSSNGTAADTIPISPTSVLRLGRSCANTQSLQAESEMDSRLLPDLSSVDDLLRAWTNVEV